MILDVTEKPYKLVRNLAAKGNSKSPQVHLYDLLDILEHYYDRDNANLFGMLETWNGESVRFYHDLPPWVQQITETYGSWAPTKLITDNENQLKPRPNNSKKSDMLISLRKLLDAGELKIPKNGGKLIDQLSIYREDDSKLQTDQVMALALAAHRAQELNVVTEIAWQSVEW